MQHSRKRKRWAKIWILVVFFLLTVAHFFFYRFSTDSLNTYKVSEGMTFGCALWSTVLLVAMWMRLGWARYVLGALICVSIFGFGALVLVLRSESIASMPTAMWTAAAGILFYIAALVPLGTAHTLRDFLSPRTGSR
ncbi:MAG TPA: hypothetical protein VGM54_23430 [Chthoniobacter sp.]|jgi:hypothetical protein